MLSKAPAFTAIAVLSLALGIGPNTAIFSLVDSLLLQEWGVDDPEAILEVYTTSRNGGFSFSNYRTFEFVEESTSDVFEAVAQHSIMTGRVGEASESEVLLGEMVTGNYFDVMGVQAGTGRTFLPEEDATLETHPVVVLSDDYWRSRHGSDPGLVGNEIRLNGRPYTVVGIAPAAFRGRITPGVGTDFWGPFIYWPFQQAGANDSFYITARGTMPPEELAAFIRSEARSIDPEIFLTSVGTMDDHLGYIYFLPRMAAVILSLVGGLALLLACIGLYGMVSYGVSRRTREMGIRLALGADRQSVVQLVLRGGLTLVAVGGGRQGSPCRWVSVDSSSAS
jgi:hypothetical protein